MIKKMCPVCDLPVNAGNYCPRCRRVIRKPYTQNVDYYLNERHPVHEAECDFHNPYLEADHHGESSRPAGAVPGKDTPGRNTPGRNTPGGTVPGRPGQNPSSGAGPFHGSRTQGTAVQTGRPAQMGQIRQPGQAPQRSSGLNGSYRSPAGTGSVKPEGTKNHTGKTVLITAVTGLAAVAVIAFVNVGGLLRDSIRGSVETTEAYSYNYESDFTELSDEEVMEAGERCLGFYHFPADGAYVSEQMLKAAESSGFGYSLDSDEFYTDNYLYEHTSYYQSIRSFYLTDSGAETAEGEYSYQYVDVNYDTATGELHDYISRLNSGEASLEFLERFLTATEESSGIALEDRKTGEIMEEARDIAKQGQSSYIYEGMFAIEIYRYEGEDAMYVYVSYNDPEAGSEL